MDGKDIMAALVLTPKERQALKARAHALKPVVLLGANGLGPATLKEIDRALLAHELIKVRVPGDDRDEREAVFERIADELAAARVQSIGKLLVLYRPAPDEEPEPPVSRRSSAPARRPAPSRAPAKAAGRTRRSGSRD